MSKPVRSDKWNDAVRGEMELLWRTCEVTDPKRFDWDVRQLLNGRGMYMRISAMTDGVPWWFIGILHGRECSYDFGKHLHNGDPLARRTVRVPAGRPKSNIPPFSFQESAVDALTMPGKQYNLVDDWGLVRTLFRIEGFNGYGYRLYRGIHSPYLWAGTNHYLRGKYLRDGIFDANAVDKQCGAAGMLTMLSQRGAL